MLKFLRARKTGLISWLIIGGIIITFTLWGYFKESDKGQGLAARVNNDKITLETFEEAYKRDYKRYSVIFKDKFNEELARLYNIKGITLERLIDSKLLVQTAKSNGIIVTDQDVANHIQNDSMFKDKDRNFNRNLYQRILRANRYSENKFEEMMREELYADKLKNLVKIGVKLSPYEIEKQYITENDKIILKYLKFEPKKIKTSVSDKEISSLIKEETGELETYYKSHITEYKQTEQVKARHILIKIDKNAPGGEQKAKKKIDELARIVTPKNFQAMAAKHSQGPTAKKSGDLGTFDKNKMDPAFSKVAFSTKPWTVSKPVKSKFGWHLILVEKKIPGFEKTLDKVEREIAKNIVKEKKQKNIAKKKAIEIVDALSKKKNLSRLTAPLSIKWQKTPSFKFGSFISGIGKAEEVISSAFKLTKKGEFIPRYFFINENYFFFKLEKRNKPDLSDLDNKISKMKSSLITKKERIFLNEWQNSLKKEATILKNPSLVDNKANPSS